jgi:hypothetical protein
MITIKATGEDESREFHVTRTPEGNYQVKIWWGKGNRVLATMNFTPDEWDKLKMEIDGE